MKRRLKLVGFGVILVLVLGVTGTLSQDQNGDVNCDGDLNILDIIYMIDHKFQGGPEPCEFAPPEMPTIVRYESDHIGPVGNEVDSWTNVAQITIDTPSPGQVYLTAQCIEHNYSSDSGVMGFGITTMDGSITFPNHPNPYDLSVYVNEYGLNIDDVVAVDAGSHTFYYNVYNDGPNYYNRDYYQVSLTATYFPNTTVQR